MGRPGYVNYIIQFVIIAQDSAFEDFHIIECRILSWGKTEKFPDIVHAHLQILVNSHEQIKNAPSMSKKCSLRALSFRAPVLLPKSRFCKSSFTQIKS